MTEPSRRFNPQIPQDAPTPIVSDTVRVNLPRAVDQRRSRYQLSDLSQSLDFFRKKAAERRSEAQTGEAAQAARFVRENWAALVSVEGEADVQAVLKAAARDGVIPNAITPEFTRGVQMTIAERRATHAEVLVRRSLTGYSPFDENGEPKDTGQILNDLEELVAAPIQEQLGNFSSNDGQVNLFIEEVAAKIRQNEYQEGFTRALGELESWAYSKASETVQDILTDLSAAPSDEEVSGAHAVLDGLVREFSSRGILRPDIAVANAALLEARTRRGSDGVEAALHFLDSVLSFQMNGQELRNMPEGAELVKLAASLETNMAVETELDTSKRKAALSALKDRAVEAYGDIENRRFMSNEEIKAAIVSTLSEDPAYTEDFDGTLDLFIESTIAGGVSDTQTRRAIDMMNGTIPWSPTWREELTLIEPSTYAQLSALDRARSTAAPYERQAVASAMSVFDDVKGAVIGTASDTITSSGEFLEAVQDLRFALEDETVAFVRNNAELPPAELNKALDEWLRGKRETLRENVRTVRERESAKQQAFIGVRRAALTPTSENIKQVSDFIASADISSSDLTTLSNDLALASRTRTAITEIMDQTPLTDLSGSPLNYSAQLANEVEAVLPGGDADVQAVIQSVFESVNEDPDKFISDLARVYGVVNESTAQTELKKRVVTALGASGTVQESIVEAHTRNRLIQSASSSSPVASRKQWMNAEERVSGSTVKLMERFASDRPSWPSDRRFGWSSPMGFVVGNYQLPQDELDALLSMMVASPDDVINGGGEFVYWNNKRTAPLTPPTREAFSTTFSTENTDWRATPMFATEQAVMRWVQGAESDGRLETLLGKIGYLEMFSQSDTPLEDAKLKFVQDQIALSKMRRID